MHVLNSFYDKVIIFKIEVFITEVTFIRQTK